MFVDFQTCLLNESEDPMNCNSWREDYFECLHGKKQAARARTIAAEKKRQEGGLFQRLFGGGSEGKTSPEKEKA